MQFITLVLDGLRPIAGVSQIAAGNTEMVDSVTHAVGPEPVHLSERLEEAINHLSLGIVVFNAKREVVFCNARYAGMYGFSPEQVKPGTPTSELIRHRLSLGLKVSGSPDEYVRTRVGRDIALDTTVQQFTDGRIIAYTVHPMPGRGGMATHEDITEREELHVRLKTQYELGRGQEEALRTRNFQFDTAINNMSQGLCFFDSDHRLIVCNDRFLEMYDIPHGRVGPGTPLVEIVDLRLEAGSFLQSFPFDKIKIDRSFVKDITENSGSLNIVRAVAALANGMGMTATAEGVGTREQLDRIASEGCTEMQGFLFSKPLPAREIERLFLNGNAANALGRIVAA